MDNRKEEINKLVQVFLELHKDMNPNKPLSGGLNFSQIKLLSIVDKEEKINQKDLAIKLNIKQPTLSIKIRPIMSKGYLVVDKDTVDHRVTFIRTTSKTKKLLKELKKEMDEYVLTIFDNFNDDELATLASLSSKLFENINNYKTK